MGESALVVRRMRPLRRVPSPTFPYVPPNLHSRDHEGRSNGVAARPAPRRSGWRHVRLPRRHGRRSRLERDGERGR
jgi:hypothetical protein